MKQFYSLCLAASYDEGLVELEDDLPDTLEIVGAGVTITLGKAEDLQQAAFMAAAEQSITNFNWPQAQLYAKLVEEEYQEFAKARSRVDKQQGAIDALELTEMIDGAADLIVVAKGFLRSLGVDPLDVMAEVWRSNASKVVDGKLQKRPDGKVLKPEGWTPPDFAQFNPLLPKKAD